MHLKIKRKKNQRKAKEQRKTWKQKVPITM